MREKGSRPKSVARFAVKRLQIEKDSAVERRKHVELDTDKC